jgi:NAD+ diphosphatase
VPRESLYKRYVPAVKPVNGNGRLAYWLAFSSGRMLTGTHDGKPTIPFLSGLPDLGMSPVRTQYLGTLEGKACYSAELAPDAAAPDGFALRDMRSLYGALDEDLYLLAGRALQIVAWDQSHQFCGRCGHPTEYLPAERGKKCPICGFVSFPRLSPATITAVLKGDQILLTHYAVSRSNMFTIIAGFVEPGETLEECVRREVAEEAGVQVKNVRYFSSQPWPFPNSLMIGFLADYECGEPRADGVEIASAAWFSADNMPEVPPKMSIAREIIDWFVSQHSGT